MEVKRSSWHYKISNFGGFERTDDNLCCYFWRFVGKSALFFVTAFLICFLIYTYFTADQVILNTMKLFLAWSYICFTSIGNLFHSEKAWQIPRNALWEHRS